MSSRAVSPALRLSTLAVASCFATGAIALPTGATVVSGTASFAQAPGQLTITNSPGAR